MMAAERRYPAWTWITTFPLALLGLGISIYLSIEHATGKIPACPKSGGFDCGLVTTSKYSELAGISVAYLGLAFFVVALVLFSPWGWRLTHGLARLVRLGSVTVGLVMVVYLVWAELYRINSICLWCTGVHVITLLLFILTVFAEAGGPRGDEDWDFEDEAESDDAMDEE